eukprot:5695885-Pleurochrysis_carterae.AAC.2
MCALGYALVCARVRARALVCARVRARALVRACACARVRLCTCAFVREHVCARVRHLDEDELGAELLVLRKRVGRPAPAEQTSKTRLLTSSARWLSIGVLQAVFRVLVCVEAGERGRATS